MDDGLEATRTAAPDATDNLERRLEVGRPEFGGALDGLRARMLAAAGGLTPRTVGRYRLGRALGSGSFGTVYEAEDPQLDRRVAIKILTVRSSKEAARVVREAQLLATLSDPNIVQVFEVGTTADGRSPYVVMELVEGPTLRKWSSEGKRSWREVVEVMLGAGRGLWAAHRAGIIHRDFKPENVLMGSDGRPRVIDFGLARSIGDIDDRSDSTLRSGSSPQLTATGQVMGTPAYMAPEVFTATCTPLSDQYALCVTLYEGLFGERPFTAETTEDLCAKLLTQEARLSADRRGVPRRISAIVLRGLRREPRERFGDLGELIAALERALRPRRWVAAVAGLAVLGGGLVVASGAPEPEPLQEVCAVGDAAWARVWEPSPIPAVLEGPLAEYQRTWQATEQALCDAGQGTIDWERRRCLDRGLRDVSALVSVLGDMDGKETVDATKAVRGLSSPADCAERDRDEVPPPSADLEPEIGPLEERLSHLRVLAATAQIKSGLDVSGPLLEDARAAGYVPLLVEVTYMRARMLLLGSDYEGARSTFEEAFFLAQQAGLMRLAARSAENLVRVTGYYLGDRETAQRWVEHAEIAFGRAGLDPRKQGVFLEGLAGLAERQGDLVEATELLREAIAAVVEAGNVRNSFHAGLLNHLGIVLYQRKEWHEAIGTLREAASVYEQHDGPDTPSRAAALDNIGACLMNLGHYRAASDHHYAALEIRRKTLAADHIDLGASYGNMGRALLELGRYDEALGYVDRALALFTARLGSEHPHVGTAYELRGNIHERRGPAGYALARREYERAARLFEAAGPAFAKKATQMRTNIQNLTAAAPPVTTP